MANFMTMEPNSSREPFTVVLFGKTGDGKSTLGNMLLSKSAFPAGASMDAITTSINSQKSDDGEWEVVDTVGLCSPGSDADNSKIAETLYNDLASGITRVDRFCYVKKATKFTRADEECWKQFDRLFGEYKENIILVFTSCEEGWLEQNEPSIKKTGLHGIPVGVDFPPTDTDDYIEEMKESTRQRSLENLRNALRKREAGPVTLKKHRKNFRWHDLLSFCHGTFRGLLNRQHTGPPERAAESGGTNLRHLVVLISCLSHRGGGESYDTIHRSNI